jgi:hypothetical protein
MATVPYPGRPAPGGNTFWAGPRLVGIVTMDAVLDSELCKHEVLSPARTATGHFRWSPFGLAMLEAEVEAETAVQAQDHR